MGLTFLPNGVGTDNDGSFDVQIADVSTGASAWSSALPYNVEITGAYVTIDTAVTGGDAAITFEIGGTAITSMVATVLNAGSAAGSTFASVDPTALNSLAAGTPLEVITDGGSTDASIGSVVVTFKRVA